MKKYVKASELVVDFNLYPRHSVDSHNVAMLTEALRTGAELPPPVVDAKSKVIVDGVHRYRAHRNIANGEDFKLMVELRQYSSEAEMLLDAIRLNAGHGQKLTPFDVARCAQLADQYKLEPIQLASALHMTVEKLDKLTLRKQATGTKGEPITLRHGARHVAGHQLTETQQRGVGKIGGQTLLYCTNQIIDAIQYDLLPLRDEILMSRLAQLYQMLDKTLERRQGRKKSA